MKTIDKDLYYKKLSTVSVNGMVMSNTSKCYVCNENLQEFTVFIGEGQRMSTIYTSCCSDCLPKTVKKAIKKGKSDAEDAIKKAEERLYEESLKYIRKSKLNKLENE